MASLLDKAKAQVQKEFRDTFTDDEKELVLAWLNNEISLTQVTRALGLNAGNTAYTFLAKGAKAIFMEVGNNGSDKKRAKK